MSAKRLRKAAVIAGYALALAYATYLRIRFMPSLFGYPRTIIYDCDTARFLRLIGLISHHYPSLPMFDSFANFPWGMKEQLPPLWAFVEASFALPISRLFGVSVFSAAGILPVITGLFFSIPAYYLGNFLFGKWVARAAVFVGLFFPLFVIKSSLGVVDHHVADVFLYMSILAVLVGSHYYYSKGFRGRGSLLAVTAGLVVALSLLVSLSSIIVVVILAVSFLSGFLLLPEEERFHASSMGFLSMSSAGLSMLLLYLLTPWFDSHLFFSRLSLFQPLLLLALAVLIGGCWGLDRAFGARDLTRRLSFLGLYLIIVVGALLVPDFSEQIVRGFYRSIGSYPLGKVVMEWMPLFPDAPQRVLAILVFLALAGLIWLRHVPLGGQLKFWRLLLLCWTLVATFYFASAKYYVYVFAPVVVISLAVAMARPPQEPTRLESRKGVDRRGLLMVWSLVPVVVSLLLLLWPITKRPLASDKGQTEMLVWMSKNTPKVSYYYSPDRKPEYGIAAIWDLGELIEVISQRPVLATGDHERGIDGITTSYRILQARSEEEAAEIMRKLELKYIFLDREYMPWIGNLKRIGEPGPDPDKIAHVATKAEISRRDYLRLFNVRLNRFLGAGNEKDGIEALQYFRLIKVTGYGKKAYKLFELVKGARLVVKAEPGTEVLVTTTIKVGKKRVNWRVSRRADSQGNIEVFLPYATSESKFPVKPGRYRIQAGDTLKYLDVNEDDVTRGNSFFLDLRVRSGR